MKLKYVILYVENVEMTLTFYQEAFGFSRKMLHASGDYGELDTGDISLSFSSLSLMRTLGKVADDKNPARPDPEAPVFEIAFETDDVRGALRKAVDAGGELVQDVRDEPWGQTTSYIRDPNGFLVEICSPLRVQGVAE